MYRLNNEENIILGEFLRALCRFGFVADAKRISSMPDAQLSILIQSDKLWKTTTAVPLDMSLDDKKEIE